MNQQGILEVNHVMTWSGALTSSTATSSSSVTHRQQGQMHEIGSPMIQMMAPTMETRTATSAKGRPSSSSPSSPLLPFPPGGARTHARGRRRLVRDSDRICGGGWLAGWLVRVAVVGRAGRSSTTCTGRYINQGRPEAPLDRSAVAFRRAARRQTRFLKPVDLSSCGIQVANNAPQPANGKTTN